jgi:hypothetical protein
LGWHLCSRHKIWREKVELTMNHELVSTSEKEKARQVILRDLVGGSDNEADRSGAGIGPPPPMPETIRNRKVKETWDKTEEFLGT